MITIAVLLLALGVLGVGALFHLRVLDAHERERQEWTRERQLLLNRIKPETAQSIIEPHVVMQPPAVTFDSDEDYWQAQGPTKEELAEMLDGDRR